MLRNGLLHQMLVKHPSLKYFLLHNIDTLGASINPLMLGHHILRNACLTYEVISRRIDDRGGGLARVDGKLRLLEGLAMPHEEDEFKLSFYNSMTTWIDIDRLLRVFGLTRNQLSNRQLVDEAVRRMAQRMPTYITIKDVKKRWGHGQEDIYPVLQFEKLWGDMTSLSEVDCEFLVVDTYRGQQLKDPAQLDGWLRDGSAHAIEQLCSWGK
jgi:UDP-N-acetylglucosamine pyrophosphorylase